MRVPIVPQAILFDLFIGDDPSVRPTAECGYQAAEAATNGPVAEGNVGAGAGATVGKLAGMERAMKGGFGSASVTLPNGLVVGAVVAVNAIGDIVDPATGDVVAGVRTSDGESLADARELLRSGELLQKQPGSNTTIGVVATNATLTKAQATKIAQMAHDGLARTIYPVHTPRDGDVIFAAGTGRLEGDPDVLIIGALAADVMARAVLRAVWSARGVPGYPAAVDLAR